jgi:uncharacterized protein YjbJ (UPF0337 family)
MVAEPFNASCRTCGYEAPDERLLSEYKILTKGAARLMAVGPSPQFRHHRHPRRRAFRRRSERRQEGTVIAPARCFHDATRGDNMDEDRAKGSMKNVKGKIKEGAGRMLGDSKLETEGKMDKAEGKIQNTIGGIKDALRGDRDR